MFASGLFLQIFFGQFNGLSHDFFNNLIVFEVCNFDVVVNGRVIAFADLAHPLALCGRQDAT